MTTTQPSLFYLPEPIEVSRPGLSIQEQFDLFHLMNPWVYRNLVRLTRELVERGRGKVGLKMLFEVLRWQFYMHTDDPSSEWKLNNNYTSRYARLIMEREPDLADVFETRELKAA